MESSVRYNESIGFANNRKLINESDVGLDSGYASTSSSAYNITNSNNTSSESPGTASLTQSTVPRKSVDLETIAENYELSISQTSSSMNETPTTRSIRQINAFHITTPQNTKNVLETTPTKSNYFYNTRSAYRSSHKKARSFGSAERSPMRQSLTASQKKARGFVTPFKDKLKSTDNLENEFLEIMEETENNENDFTISMEGPAISPIGHHNRSTTNTPRSKQRVSFQRYPSGIESSTPKSGAIKRGNPQTVAKSHFISSAIGEQEDALHKKNRLIRKTQSFSPCKRNTPVLREISTNFQNVLEKHEEQIEDEEEQLVNPARKMLTFGADQFESLVNMKPKNHVYSQISTTELESQIAERSNIELKPRLIAKAKTRLIKRPTSNLLEQTPLAVTPKNVCSTVTSATVGSSGHVADISLSGSSISEKIFPSSCSLNSIKGPNDSTSDMDISVLPESCITPMKSESSEENIPNYCIRSDYDLLLHSQIKTETPVGSNQFKQSIQESVQRKPMKKLKRSISLNPPKSPCVKHNLPCTPPKSYKRKRTPSEVYDETKENRGFAVPAAKRKLYDSKPELCKKFYMGYECLDILGHLARYNTGPVIINRILADLSDEDLISAYTVSKTWRNIIDEDYAANRRRLKYLKDRRSSKENAPQPSISGILGERRYSQRKPFNRRNINDNPVCKKQEKRSPPVSPSKRKFHENQKVVRKLKPDQKLTKCPRCNSYSIIDRLSPTKQKGAAASTTTSRRTHLLASKKAYESCPILKTEQRSIELLPRDSKWKSFDDTHINLEFAECTRSSCVFKFCTKCLCAYHPDVPCPLKPLGSSPTSDDDNQIRVRDVRSSKRNLRRLVLD